MKSEEVMMLSLAGVSIFLKAKSSMIPKGKLLKALPDGEGAVHLYVDKEMEKPFMSGDTAIVYRPNEWFKGKVIGPQAE